MNSRRRLLRLGSVLLGVLIALLAGELLVRLFVDFQGDAVVFQGRYQFSDNPVLGYALKPSSTEVFASVNSLGFRGREVAVPKPDDTFRIVLIGDSVTFGYYMPEEDTYGRQLESLITRYAASNGPIVEVLNLGVIGYNIAQIVENLRIRGIPLEPDLIIYGYVLNDAQAFSLEAEALALLKRRRETGLEESKQDSLGGLLEKSGLLSLGLRALRSAEWYERIPHVNDPGFTAFYGGTHKQYFDELYHNTASWKRVGVGMSTLGVMAQRNDGVPVLVALFPLDDGEGFTTDAFRTIHHKVLSAAESNGLRTMDFTSALELASTGDLEKLYYDFVHPSATGNRVIAMALYQSLSEQGLLPEGISIEPDRNDWQEVDAPIARLLRRAN